MIKNFLNPTVQTFQLGRNICTIETGMLARRSTASVMIHMEGTSVLVSVVEQREDKKQQEYDFFPLVVNYQERYYSIGKIPGSFFRREGRSGENEILTSRLIDRSLRPVFPKGFNSEIQIIATVVSVDPRINPDILSIVGASAALSISHIPFREPVGAVRVGYISKKYVLNPSYEEIKRSELDLIISSTEDQTLMIESRSSLLKEDVILQAIEFAREGQKVIIDNIKMFSDKVGLEKISLKEKEMNVDIEKYISDNIEDDLKLAYLIPDKKSRLFKVREIKEKTFLESSTTEGFDPDQVSHVFSSLERKIVRNRILDENLRIDGRRRDEIRPVDCRVGVLPRTHGSSLFTRGETQALVVVTLGNDRDAQIKDEIIGERIDHFIFHYNFLPYSVGEIGLVGVPKRREIGHGNLAKKGMMAVMPSFSDFSYTVRVVSEIIESNGSSSMASVCGSSLAMMDAGIPIKSAVAGIAMGLIKEKERFIVLSDILGDEDHLGDMDFKVIGNEEGISAMQMDIKIDGVDDSILRTALIQSKEARLKVLQEMRKAISRPRESVSKFAPRVQKIYVDPKKIKDIIGKGGSTIRSLTEETNSVIDVEDTGEVRISSVDESNLRKAISKIKEIISEIELGKIYKAKIIKIAEFGLFVSILSNKKEGLVVLRNHGRNIYLRGKHEFRSFKVGQIISVKVSDIDRHGRVRFVLS
ncbi:polyribonucleotide nucleotidyltransferase [Candidatus Riesia pediculischaeffi]|uniref:polyribonucleotide nucleotidyltransferase n=1 Tax=Candidatus Riesia pediculischaeffi TaxID=428411 RepID=UPI0009B78EF6